MILLEICNNCDNIKLVNYKKILKCPTLEFNLVL